MERIVVIINIEAGRAKKHRPNIADYFDENELKVAKYFVVKPKELKQAYQETLKIKPGIIVLGGGDGTIITAIDYFSQHEFKGSFGVLPLGTANYLVRNLDIPLKPRQAVAHLAAANAHRVTLPTANDEVFALMAMVGISSAISNPDDGNLKQRFGQFAYIIETTRQLFKHQSFEYQIEINNGQEKLSGRSHQIAVVNADLSRQMKIVPDSTIHRRHLQLSVYRSEKSKFKLLISMIIYIITLGRAKIYLTTRSASNATITTNPKREYSLDGEVEGQVPMEVTTKGRQIKLIY